MDHSTDKPTSRLTAIQAAADVNVRCLLARLGLNRRQEPLVHDQTVAMLRLRDIDV